MIGDHEIYARLCDVPLPDGLLARLRQIAIAEPGAGKKSVRWTAGTIDAALQGTPLPDGMLARLRQIAVPEKVELAAAAAGWDAEEIDVALRRVPLPMGWAARVRLVRPRVRRRVSAGWAAAAASLAVAVGLAYLSSLAGFLMASHGQLLAPPPRLQASEPANFQWLAGDARPFTSTPHAALPDAGPLFEHLDLDRSTAVLSPNVSATTADNGSPAESSDRELPDGDLPGNDLGDGRWLAAARAASLDAIHSDFPRYPFRAENMTRHGGNVLPRGRGIEPPPLAGLDLMAWEATGIHPAVSPSVDPRLQVSRVPLDVDAGSYDAARQAAREGLLPPPQTIRVEEFVAALNFQSPPAEDRAFALEASLGPSPFGDEGLRLLHVGIQAAEAPASARQPTHLTLAVDVSASMRQGKRLEIVRQALVELAGWLGPNDRVSLVAFDNSADVLLRGATAARAEQLAIAAGFLAPGGGTNFSAGLQAAFAVAAEETPAETSGIARRVVLLSDGGATLQRDVLQRIEEAVTAQSGAGLPLSVIDLAQQFEPDGQLARLSAAGRGRLHQAATLAHVRRALREELTGLPQTAARDVRLSVTFNPKSVLLYRLLGHEAAAAVPAARLAADLHFDQGAAGLYELLLVPDGEDLLAEVTVQWRDAAGGEQREERRTIHRAQIAGTFAESAPALQAAALAAETAELLRESYFARNGSFAAVLGAAGQADSGLRRTPAFADWEAFVRDLQQARPALDRRRAGSE